VKRWLWLLVAAALAVSISCSLVSGALTPTEGSTPVPGEAAPVVEVEDEVEIEVEDDDPPPTLDDTKLRIDPGGLSRLDSYRAVLSWRMEGDDGTVESFSMEQEATRNPRAERSVVVSDGESFEMIQIEDQMWMGFGDEWVQSGAGDEMDEFGSFLTTSDDWVSDLEEGDYEYLGQETVNGHRARHYRTERAGDFVMLFGDDAETDDDVESAVAEIWIADEAGLPEFMVRFVMEMTGTFDGVPGTITMHQDVMDVNQPMMIEAPEGGLEGGLPDDLSLYPGAADVTSFGGMTIYSVAGAVTVEDVHSFYEDALVAAGWEPSDESMAFEGVMMSTWQLGGEELTLTITSGDDGGVDVMIIREVGEE